jgi:Putative transmembrane protein (PGPGW)
MTPPDEIDGEAGGAEAPPRRRHLPALPIIMRIAVLVVGWLVILVGLAGLALPGIQGCLTIVVGAALLSLASEMIHRWLRRALQRWPKVWDRVETFRGWMHAKLSRSGGDPESGGDA